MAQPSDPLSRRRLLAAAAAGVALPAGTTRPKPPRHRLEPKVGAESIGRRRIPKTGELLPMIGLGTARTFNAEIATAADGPLLEVMRGFLALGGTLIDSSPMYGRAEGVVGALLKALDRHDVFYATKVWTDKGVDVGKEQMKTSGRRMGTERFDLLQVHNLVGLDDHLPTLREQKAAGDLRYLGITEMRDFAQVEQLIREADLDFIQIPYSLAERAVEERVLPAAREHGVAVLVMRPFAAGRLFRKTKGKELPGFAAEFCSSWAQFFLKFVLSHPAVTCPIPATSKPHHLIDNMTAGTGPMPDANQRAKILEYIQGL